MDLTFHPPGVRIDETAYIVWETENEAPRFGAGVFQTRAEALAVANHSMSRGDYQPGQLEVRPLKWAKSGFSFC